MKQKKYNKLNSEERRLTWEEIISKATPKKWKGLFDKLSRCQLPHDRWIYYG